MLSDIAITGIMRPHVAQCVGVAVPLLSCFEDVPLTCPAFQGPSVYESYHNDEKLLTYHISTFKSDIALPKSGLVLLVLLGGQCH